MDRCTARRVTARLVTAGLAAAVAVPLLAAPSSAAVPAEPVTGCNVGAWPMDRADALRHGIAYGMVEPGEEAEHLAAVEPVFARWDRNGDGYLCASYAPSSSPRAPLGHVNLTDNRAASQVWGLRFTKNLVAVDAAGLHFAGTFSGSRTGTLTSDVVVARVTGTTTHVDVTWVFSFADGGSLTTVQKGVLKRNGDVVLSGSVVDGARAGARTVDTGHVLSPDPLVYEGVMSVLPTG